MIAPVPINIAQATLGSKISVKTLDGKKVAIKIPPGTPSGKRFRVPRSGNREGRSHGRSDRARSRSSVPEKLTEEQEKAMREFAEASGLKY